MRFRENRRKALILEEAWKAIASKLMGGLITYLYKTARKHFAEVITVTQELGDIIGNTVVKDSIISNSDTFILLDQTKFKDNFEAIASILSLNKVEQNKIFTINNLNNKEGEADLKNSILKEEVKAKYMETKFHWSNTLLIPLKSLKNLLLKFMLPSMELMIRQ